ncbi:MAG TPA: MmgE/PrpD family protein [Candidatus Saccharimonadales bacterium]|jgi:2-methylcitrate dehydratase PrpD|nr:MmgE/PrpD family protein [Candidatus Saccharimonadales bacterium]
MDPITRNLIHFCHELKAKDLDNEVAERTKYMLLDFLGVAIAGSLSESSVPIQRMLMRAAPKGSCTVIGTMAQTCPEFAALANGASAHSIELDDTHQAGSIHPGVVIFSTAISLSEMNPNIDFAQFVAAVVAGYEVATRLAVAVQPKFHYELGFHPTATCGVFGAAVTASKLLRLSEEQMLSATGIAGSMAAGSLEFLADGTWTKRLHPGLAAQNGILAANLAAEGFRGPTTILEGRDGFLAGYSRKAIPESILQDLGKQFEIMRTSVKPHACCRYIQAPIDGLIDLAIANDIQTDQVERVEVAILEAGWSLVCEPRKRKYEPANAVDAQFSVPFGAAIALTHRKAGLDQFSDENIRSPRIKSLMGKVVLQKDIRIEKNFPVEWPSFVKVYLTNGQFFEKYVRFPKGDPENPLTWQELAAKFQSLAKRVLPRDRCDQIVNSVKDMKSSSVLRNIWRLTSRSAAVATQVN